MSPTKEKPLSKIQRRFLFICVFFITNFYPLDVYTAEKELHLALIIKFSQFVQWPSELSDKFNFCFYRGKEYESLTINTNSLKIKNTPINFIYLSRNTPTQDIQKCHLLFLSEGSAAITKNILQRASYGPTLTISTLNEFANMGGMVELVKLNNRYRFKINLTPVEKAKLSISASVLEMSTVIGKER